jgi:hypothetical protein
MGVGGRANLEGAVEIRKQRNTPCHTGGNTGGSDPVIGRPRRGPGPSVGQSESLVGPAKICDAGHAPLQANQRSKDATTARATAHTRMPPREPLLLSPRIRVSPIPHAQCQVTAA